MTSIQAQTVQEDFATIGDLCLSPYNARLNQADATATAALEASILADGLIHAINIHPMRGSKKWGVFAGGRRYRAIRNLVARGAVAADWPVKVKRWVGFAEVDLIEKSMAENWPRRDLRMYELASNTRRLTRLGRSVEQIAEAFGQTELSVRQMLRLADLAPPIFEAFEKDLILVEQAQAFGATGDSGVQLSAWVALCAGNDAISRNTNPERIRAQLGVGDHDMARRLAVVGDQAYRDAGGAFELDLYADEALQRGRVADKDILEKLFEAKVAEVRDAARRAAGRDVRFAHQPPQNDYGTDLLLEIHPKQDDGGILDLPKRDIIATVAIGDGGVLATRWWWESRKAKHGGMKPSRPAPPPSQRVERVGGSAIDDRASPGATREANDEIREEVGLSPETIQVFRSLRRVIMRAMLIRDARDHGTVGLDYLIWSQLRLLIGMDRASQVGMRAIGAIDVDSDVAREEVHETEASAEWRQVLFELQSQTFITGEDHDEAFRDYRASAPAMKDLAAAAVAGLALERSLNFGTYRVPVHDAVASEIRASDDEAIRELWRPSATLLGRIPASHRLAIAEPFVERVTFGAWQREKSDDLTARVRELVTGRAAGVRASMAEAAARWVHPLLRFTPIGADAPVDVDAREAAE